MILENYGLQKSYILLQLGDLLKMPSLHENEVHTSFR